MNTETEELVGPSATSLASGILSDLQRLVEQQLLLTRREIEVQFRDRAAAATVVAFGAGFCFLGAIVSSMTLVHFLYWVTSQPGAEQAWLPLWACHAVVAAGLLLIGGVVAGVGCARCTAALPSPNSSTALSEESVAWTTPRK